MGSVSAYWCCTKDGEFNRIIGTDGSQSHCAGKSYITPDTVKLPSLDKRIWLAGIEEALRSASPPMVGKQDPSLISLGFWNWYGLWCIAISLCL